MNGIVLIGGDAPAAHLVRETISRAHTIVAADSGLSLCRKYGIRPDYIVGDMDSIGSDAELDEYPEAEIRRYPVCKDETDTELGLSLLEKAGISERVIIGGGGGRLDHLLGIFSLFHRENAPARWISPESEVLLIRDSLELACRPHETVSFFPVGKEAARMSSTGLKWRLDGLSWEAGAAGISNLTTGTRFQIVMKCGRLIAVRSLNS